VRWLGCSLAWLNLEAFALAEVKSKPRSTLALDALVTHLNEYTGGSYAYRMDECPESNGQHLVWFWDQRQVQVRGFRMHGAINPYGEACAGRLRPGFGVFMAFASGLDFHAIAVHLKSGNLRDDMALRRKSIEGLGGVATQIAHESFDSDVIVLGDMNSMGCEGCEGLDNSAAEAMAMDTHLAALHVPMRRVPSDLSCSEYYEGHPSLLDHFFVTAEAREIPRQVKVEIQGYCRDLACESFPVAEASKGGPIVPQAFAELSDHCPIVLSILDQDLD
jgi:hypothetical protein